MGSEACPNCNQRGHPDISAAECGGDYHTFQCANDNCRVARYLVEPDDRRDM